MCIYKKKYVVHFHVCESAGELVFHVVEEKSMPEQQEKHRVGEVWDDHIFLECVI
jgi:hypothetical protein